VTTCHPAKIILIHLIVTYKTHLTPLYSSTLPKPVFSAMS